MKLFRNILLAVVVVGFIVGNLFGLVWTHDVYYGLNADQGTTGFQGKIFVEVLDGARSWLLTYEPYYAVWRRAIDVPEDEITSGYFLLPQQMLGDGAGTDIEVTPGANLRNYCYRAYLPYPLTITEAVVQSEDLAAAAVTDYIGVAIYEDASNGVRLTTGAVAYAADAAPLVIDLEDVTLDPGWYRFCTASSDATNLGWFGCLTDDEQNDVLAETASEVAFGLATNAATGNGVMPATTGALASDALDWPLIKFGTN